MGEITKINHVVKPGDCCASLGFQFKVPWKKIWEYGENAEVKQLRKSPDVLNPGDKLVIPREMGEEQCATDQRHNFVKKIEKIKLRVVLLEEDQPRKNLKYTLKIGSDEIQGTTDGSGKLEHEISPGHKKASLITDDSVYELNLGHLNPKEVDSGVEQRLQNLGFLGRNKSAPIKSAAVTQFKDKNGLPKNDTVDDATRDKLLEKHGS